MRNKKDNILKDVLIIVISLLMFGGFIYMFFIDNTFNVDYNIKYTLGFLIIVSTIIILACIFIFILIMSCFLLDELKERKKLKYIKYIQSSTNNGDDSWYLKAHSLKYLKRLYNELKNKY